MTPMTLVAPFTQSQWAGFPGDKLISPWQTAYMLEIHIRTLRAWGDKGKIAYATLPNHHRRYRVADVKNLMKPHKRKGVSK